MSKGRDIAAGNVNGDGTFPASDVINTTAASPSGESPATPAASGGGVSTLFYPQELQGAGDSSSRFRHWVKFNSFVIRNDSVSDVVNRIKDKATSIKSGADIVSLLREVGTAIAPLGTSEKVIALYVPAQAVNKIDINYSYAALSDLETAENMFGELLSSLESGNTGNLVDSIVQGTGIAIANRFNKKFSDQAKAYASKRTGIAINPRRTAIFDYPQLREFSFNFVFSPRDRGEEKMVNDIIAYFKQAALPRIVGIGAFQLYPNEFELTCMVGANENRALFKTKRCVLKNIEVNHTPASMFNAFPTGSPTQCTLALSFLETDILTSQDIESGVAY